jgi:enoyl reductase-like protein
MYSAIRRISSVLLIVDSGFSNLEISQQFLTGD